MCIRDSRLPAEQSLYTFCLSPLQMLCVLYFIQFIFAAIIQGNSHLFTLSVNILPEIIGFSKVICFGDLRFPIRISASSGKQHPFITETNIIDYCKFVIWYCLFICPEKIICWCHKQSGIFYRIPFISPKRRIRIFLSNTIKSLDECLDFGG